MVDTTIQLGQKVQDRISGFVGVVTTVGDHLSGCTRIGVQPVGDEETSMRGDEEFFFPDQLEVLEEETEFTDEAWGGPEDHHISLGQFVRDEVNGFTGVAEIINYRLWTCPQVLVKAQCKPGEDEEPDTTWADVVRLEAGDEEFTGAFDDQFDEDDASTTGPASTDSRPRNDSPNA